MAETPKTPAKLGVAGRKLWRDVVAVYELRTDELRVLELGCRALDDEKRLRDALADSPVVVEGSTGRDVVNGLFREVRLARKAVASLLDQVGLPDPETVAADRAKAREWQARRAARARWSG